MGPSSPTLCWMAAAVGVTSKPRHRPSEHEQRHHRRNDDDAAEAVGRSAIEIDDAGHTDGDPSVDGQAGIQVDAAVGQHAQDRQAPAASTIEPTMARVGHGPRALLGSGTRSMVVDMTPLCCTRPRRSTSCAMNGTAPGQHQDAGASARVAAGQGHATQCPERPGRRERAPMSTMTTVDTGGGTELRAHLPKPRTAIVFVVCVIGMLVNLGAELLIDGQAEADQRDTVDQLIGVRPRSAPSACSSPCCANPRLAHDRGARISALVHGVLAVPLLFFFWCGVPGMFGAASAAFISRRTDEGPHPYDRAGARRRRRRAGVRTAQSHRRGWPGPDLVDLPPQLIQRGSDLGRRDDTIDAADGDDLRMPRTAGWVPSLASTVSASAAIHSLDTNLIDPVQIDQLSKQLEGTPHEFAFIGVPLNESVRIRDRLRRAQRR